MVCAKLQASYIIDILSIDSTVLRTYSTFVELFEGHSGQDLRFRTDGADGTYQSTNQLNPSVAINI